MIDKECYMLVSKLDEIYRKYKVLNITKEEYYDIVNDVINENKDNNLSDDDLIKIVVQKLDDIMYSLDDDDLFKENTSSLDIINLYFKEVKGYNVLTVEEERELAKRIKNGDSDATRELIERNLKLVIKIAKEYLNRGLPLEDLIEEGNMGLMIAIDRFDPDKGKFASYASWWIRNSIRKAIMASSKTIRLSEHQYHKIYLYLSAETKLEQTLGRKPNKNELANYLGWSIEQIDALRGSASNTISIHEYLHDDPNFTIMDTIESDENIEEDYLNKEIKIKIFKLLNNDKLTKQERTVLMYRYGFINNKPLVLEEIAKKYNLTRERIRQIELNALRKIICSQEIMDLINYYPNSDELSDKITELRNNISGNDKRNNKTIYWYLRKYDKNKVDFIMSRLTDERMEFIKSVFDEDLNKPVNVKLNDDNKQHFYYTINFIKNKLKELDDDNLRLKLSNKRI